MHLEHKILGFKQVKNLFLLVFILIFTACSSKQDIITKSSNKPYKKKDNETIYISQKQLSDIYYKYGKKGLERVKDWDFMMHEIEKSKTLTKIKSINDFFNKFKYQTDISHWRTKDYWATPFEFMGTGAGDCEDYAIAKYYSLKKLNIPEDKLRISYVIYTKKNTQYEQNHMVLSYFYKANSTPIILDNINKKLKLANKRKDLKFIYSFNADGLWQSKKKGSIRVGDNTLELWEKLIKRI